jgi:radical SAM superfamily enzyme YgiQ (UPF0313 family)
VLNRLRTEVNSVVSSREPVADAEFLELLETRRRRLAEVVEAARRAAPHDPEAGWHARTYPVLAILAPVMASHEGKIEFPGDPMCLYSATSTMIGGVVRARELGLVAGSPYNDLCPDLGILPDRAHRLGAPDSGVRDYGESPPNTDQWVFDPRVWNDEVQRFFREEVLVRLRPSVVLISSVSPGHRYAIAMAREVRRLLPDALVVLGGRHADETMHYDEAQGVLELQYSSTLQGIDDGRLPQVVDFIASGECYWLLDHLMRAVSLATDLETRLVRVEDVVTRFDQLARASDPIPGRSVLVALSGDIAHVRPVRGPQVDLAALPSPYRPFGIRARFPIFEHEEGRAEGEVQRTAHMMVTTACPYHCNFCSEGVTVVGRMLHFPREAVQQAVERVFEYVTYGAEAIFFDDSVFWGGNLRLAREFCELLADARRLARKPRLRELLMPRWLEREDDWARLAALQWGAQLTADFLTTLQSRGAALDLLALMKDAGCTYLYVGIESMTDQVMQHVHKNLQRPNGMPWGDKIRQALEVAREAGVRVGSSVLFGLEGETRDTVDQTIESVAELVGSGLLWVASPNILTYHPGTAITRAHGMIDELDYHSIDIHNRPPYTYFEEAFPGVVSRNLSEDDVWYIHNETQRRWGQTRNSNPMKPIELVGATRPDGQRHGE